MNDTKEKSAVGVGTPATEREMTSKDIITQAVEKINSCGKFKDRYASVIAEPVKRALQEFCRQEEEFARAVIDGGSAEDCINTVAKDISKKQAVSDPEVFQAAAEYFFPGAVIEYRMVIHMSKYEFEKPEQKKSINLSLNSLLDW